MYSGSNFVKAFSVFVEQIHSEDAESEADQESSEEAHAHYLDTFSILEKGNGLVYQLPTHQRCMPLVKLSCHNRCIHEGKKNKQKKNHVE